MVSKGAFFFPHLPGFGVLPTAEVLIVYVFTA
jgi:hypothetical protein